MDHQKKAKQLLQNIESELKILGMWEANPPSGSALESANPFCYDTLEIHQWLQWVFLPKTKKMLEQNHSFPGQCDIASYAEVVYEKSGQDRSILIEHIRVLDRFCTDS